LTVKYNDTRNKKKPLTVMFKKLAVMDKVPSRTQKPLTVVGVQPRRPVGLARSTERPPRGQNAVARIGRASQPLSRMTTQSPSASPMWPRAVPSSAAENYSAPRSNSKTMNWLP
jgi:hypothetical protein